MLQSYTVRETATIMYFRGAFVVFYCRTSPAGSPRPHEAVRPLYGTVPYEYWMVAEIAQGKDYTRYETNKVPVRVRVPDVLYDEYRYLQYSTKVMDPPLQDQRHTSLHQALEARRLVEYIDRPEIHMTSRQTLSHSVTPS